MPAYEAERYDDAKALLLEGLEVHPGNASLLYNLACMVERLSGVTTGHDELFAWLDAFLEKHWR